MTGRRIEFPSDDAARFNALRDQWRGVAAGHPLSRSGLRVATVLPTFVSRDHGYAFPTDEQLMAELRGSVDTVKRGLSALEAADLIERKTRVKRDAKGEAAGRERRIYLCLPTVRSERTVARGEGAKTPEVKVQKQTVSEGAKPSEVKVQEVKVHPEVKGQKRRGEGAYGCTNIPDSDTPDFQIRSGDRKGSVYTREAAPSPRPAPSLPRNPHWVPDGYGEDAAFLELFDRFVLEVAGPEVEAGALERITAEAFDRATRAGDFMPIFWSDVVAVRKNPFAEWFRYRAGSLIHSEVA